jgi:hypothetical protein
MFLQTGCDYSKIRNVFINVVITVVDGQMGKQLVHPNLFEFPGVLWDPTLTSFNSFIVHIKMPVGRIVFLNNKEAADSYYLAYIHIKAPNDELLKIDSSRSHNILERMFSTVRLIV